MREFANSELQHCSKLKIMQEDISPRFGTVDRVKIPYKLMHLTPDHSRLHLWDHTIVGEIIKLSAFSGSILEVHINGSVLNYGLEKLKLFEGNDTPEVSVRGELTFNEQNVYLLNLQKKNDVSSQKLNRSFWNSSSGLIEFSCESKDFKSIYRSYDQLKAKASSKCEVISLERFLTYHGTCFIDNNIANPKLETKFDLAIPAAVFTLNSISPLNVIPTALAKGLTDPSGNCFLYNKPKTGFITFDDTHKILLVMDSDPKLSSLPVFGIWVSGVKAVNSFFVWAACVRYFNHFHSLNSSQVDDPFLVIYYDKVTYVPKFFDCSFDNLPGTEFILYQSTLSQSLTAELLEDGVKMKMEISNDSTKGQSLSSNLNKGKPKRKVKSRVVRSSTPNSQEMNHTPVRFCDSRLSETCNDKSKQDSVESPPPNELYKLIKAQEQQIKLLREQLNVFLKGQSQPANSPGNTTIKETTSTSTMTSLLWTTPSSSREQRSCGCNNVPNKVCEELNFSASPEIVRKEQLQDPQNVEESLANLQMFTISDTMTSSLPSIHVDINEYSDLQLNNNELSLSDWSPPTTDSTTVEKIHDGSFYDSILSKIQRILKQQGIGDDLKSVEISRNILCHTNTNQKSIFDSMLIPRLNYVSIFPSETDNEYSIEFQALARKYSATSKFDQIQTATSHSAEHRAISTTNSTIFEKQSCYLSFATQQYLQRHSLKK